MQLNLKQISQIDSRVSVGANKEIVMIDTFDDKALLSLEDYNLNIYCINKEYDVIWQIREIKTKPIGKYDRFVYLSRNDKDEIIADRSSGFVYKIDPETGEAEQVGFHK